MEKSILFVHKAYLIAGLLLIHYFCFEPYQIPCTVFKNCD